MTVKIVCDTAADLNIANDATLYKKYNIDTFPMHVMFGEEEHKEYVNITPSAFYERVKTETTHPTTSQASTSDILDTFHKFEDQHEEILAIFLSSELSGCYANGVFAKKMFNNRKKSKCEVHLYDSKLASTAMGLLVLYASQLAELGLKATEIVEKLDYFREHDLICYFTVEDLKWLFQGGRLSRAKYYIASFLDKKPVLQFNDGKLEALKSVSGVDNALKVMVDLAFLKYETEDNSNLTLNVVHADYLSKANEIIENVKERYSGVKIGPIFSVGATIGAHTGPKTLAIVLTRNVKVEE